jgi:hypothetical protein
MMTPEAKVKRLIDKYLFTLHLLTSDVDLYCERPVPTGFGKSGLDYTCCISGRFVAIEAKAPGEWLTPRQRTTALGILKAGGKVFVISGPEGLDALKAWVQRIASDPADYVGSHSQTFRRLSEKVSSIHASTPLRSA